MKILIVHSAYLVPGGEETVIKQEAELLQAEHTVDKLFFHNQTGIKGVFQFVASIWNAWVARKLRAKINTFKPDVIHVHNWNFATGPIVFRTAHQMGVPVLLTVHNYRLICPSAMLLNKGSVFAESIDKNFPWMAIREKVFKNSYFLTFWLAFIVWFHKKIGTWHMISKFIVLTPFAKEIFLRSTFGVPADKFIVKPNFSYDKGFDLDLNRDSHFLFVGRLAEEKGIRVLINAVAQTDIHLKIIGDGPMRDFIEQSTAAHGRISYLGHQKNDAIIKEMSKASALIFPSIWYEGMPMTLIEAFSVGTPVIASKLGAMTSMVVDHFNGLHFQPGDAQDLSEKILNWREMKAAEKEMYGSNARAFYDRNFTAEENKRLLTRIYQECISHELHYKSLV